MVYGNTPSLQLVRTQDSNYFTGIDILVVLSRCLLMLRSSSYTRPSSLIPFED